MLLIRKSMLSDRIAPVEIQSFSTIISLSRILKAAILRREMIPHRNHFFSRL